MLFVETKKRNSAEEYYLGVLSLLIQQETQCHFYYQHPRVQRHNVESLTMA